MFEQSRIDLSHYNEATLNGRAKTWRCFCPKDDKHNPYGYCRQRNTTPRTYCQTCLDNNHHRM